MTRRAASPAPAGGRSPPGSPRDAPPHGALDPRVLASVVEHSGDFIGLCTPDLKPFFVNEAGRRMVGLEGRDVGETHVLDYFWPEDRARIEAEAVPAVLREGRWSGEARFRHFVTGEPIPTLWNAFAIRDERGRPVAWATISPDLGAVKRPERRAREALGALNVERDKLEAVIGALPVGIGITDAGGTTLSMNDVALRLHGFRSRAEMVAELDGYARRFELHGMDGERLREDDRRKDDFLAMLSHELRDPLAPIRNAIHLLDLAAIEGETARRAVGVLRRQAEHLTRIVDDLLDVTRIARGKVELRRTRVDLADLVRRAGEDHGATAGLHGARLAVRVPEGSVWVDADATRVAQVIGNLLQNAGKFTSPGDEVTLSLEVAGPVAELRVRDTGLGIDPEIIGRIFDPFVQADGSLARTQGGLGLGLALGKGIAELHGGAVRAESGGIGRGSEFVVTLPLAAPPGPAPGGEGG